MISPYVRRLRLADELIRVRTAKKITHDQLAKMIKGHRPTISKLENGHIAPNLDDVFKILEALEVTGDEWELIVRIAREAAERGWWELKAKSMGERQALYANLEAGANRVREFQPAVAPGLLQSQEYAGARLKAGWTQGKDGVTIEGILDGRKGRQRMFNRPSGPLYEVILDEVFVRRASAPPEALARQFQLLAEKAAEQRISLLILPLDAVIPTFVVPTVTFSMYDYPEDPPVVAVENVGADYVATSPEEVSRYVDRYNLLRDACLTPNDSIELLITSADRLLTSPEKETT
ncbi:helix-turn-helix transcriptional regulator [Actinocorallia sp. API 0066]|uniref:helix-turn-helix domain-containing protein n=1 Tax=Actinocorallia sp. API 0066 TaxID=2896846 RepID=UPI001E50CF5D|nr:helix-turn-helix transcriptional regulator [Actinocorallia sp. API 0066]MCD0449104.1 helix-turn-helix transcriptional regulator [Actinocorallia sp. API 0066]